MLNKERFILVVDDIEPSRATVVNMLNVLGYNRTLQAADGKEALQILEQNPDIQLVISDWKMPRMNGAQLLSYLRSSSQWESLPFLFLTSKSEGDDVAQAVDLGVTDYMIKPLSIEVLLEKMNSVSPANPRVRIAKAMRKVEQLCSENDFDGAKKVIEQLLQDFPSMEPRLIFETARVNFLEGNIDQARELTDQAINKNSLLSQAWHLKARLEKRAGKWADAQACVHKALEIHPRNVDYHISLADIFLYIKEFNKAREIFQKTINISPEDDIIKKKIWECYLKHDQCERGEKDFGLTILDCLSSDVLNNYAVALRKQDKMHRAVELYAIALKKDPSNPSLLYNAAVSDYYNGNKERAIKRLEKAISENPEFIQAEQFLNALTQRYSNTTL